MKSTEFVTEASTKEIIAEIAKIYNIDPATMKKMVAITRKAGLKLNVIEWLIQISQQCQPFIREVGWDKCFELYRGVPGVGNREFIEKRVRLDSRTPKSMDPYLFDEINRYFTEIYGQPFRNAMLTTGDKFHTRLFGETFMVFPKGDFKFLWNENVDDFNFALSNFSTDDNVRNRVEGSVWSSDNRDMINQWFLEEFVKETDWHTIDMGAAIAANAEIMIRCKDYWGINCRDHDKHIPAMTAIMRLAV